MPPRPRKTLLWVSYCTAASVAAFSARPAQRHWMQTSLASSFSSSYPRGTPSPSSSQDLSNVTRAYMESISSALEYADDKDELEIAQRRLNYLQNQKRQNKQIQLPLDQPLGLSLVAVQKGQILSDQELDLDSMNIVQLEAQPQSPLHNRLRYNPQVGTQVRENTKIPQDGLIIASVQVGSPAYIAGMRPGDVLLGVSATMGNKVWPKSTLQGVQSAISSRRSANKQVILEMDVAVDAVQENRFELELQKPLGIEIQETPEGFVVVTGFNEHACKLVRHAVQVGDRVVAVEASLGGHMWPVSTVEGVVSASTGRLPGQSIRLQFERPLENMVTMPPPVVEPKTPPAATPSLAPEDLIRRCRDVLERYAVSKETGTTTTSFQGKYAVPAIVADKVVDALASSSTSIDSVTLSMIMQSYLSVNKPEGAIRVFEAAAGFAGDGSIRSIDREEGPALVPNESSLNLYTVTSLLQAHSMNKDLLSVQRVLAALEGRSGVEIGGVEAAPWPWTGELGSLRPDTQCYNIAMAAAEKVGEAGLPYALEIFNKLADPSVKDRARPQKDTVTFNTLISILCNTGQFSEAFRAFDKMKRLGLRPDKYTYTALIKACTVDGDMQELIYDMQEQGIQPDVVTYNTMMKTLCANRQWTQATRMVTEMEARGIAPDSITYGLLMTALVKAGKMNACLALFEAACTNPRTEALTRSVHLYTTAITAAGVLGDHDRALELLARMTAVGIKPNVKTLTAVMSACLNAKQPDLALKIYNRIDQPDGYAMLQGIRAHCDLGDQASAALIMSNQGRRSRVMIGKQVMEAYELIILSAVENDKFETARNMVSDLLARGFIPNKRMSHNMVKSMKALRTTRGMVQAASVESAPQAFRFLLFMIDAFQRRKISIDTNMYATVLSIGGLLGGMHRKIATLLVEKRVGDEPSSNELLSSEQSTTNDQEIVKSWEELYLKYEEFKEGLSADHLPSLPVQTSKREVRRVLQAEQAVSYASKRKPRQQASV